MHRWATYLGRKQNNFLDNPGDDKVLMQNVIASLYYDTAQYSGFVKRIILVMDSDKMSWRTYLNPKGDDFYKKNRDGKERKFNYDKFKQVLTDFRDILSISSVYFFAVDNIEGDDLIYKISKILSDRGESSIIITSDSDICQLVEVKTDKFTIVYDSMYDKKYHNIDKHLESAITSSADAMETISDIIDSDDDVFSDDLSSMITAKQKSPHELISFINNNSSVIEPNKILLGKILGGDKNDNIPSCYYRFNKSGSTKISFTKERAHGVYEKIKDTITDGYFERLYNDESLRRELAIKVVNEVKGEIAKIDGIAHDIKRNIQFIFLNDVVYPANILDRMNQFLDENFVIGSDYDEKHSNLVIKGFPTRLFDGTKYEVGDVSVKYYDSKDIKY